MKDLLASSSEVADCGQIMPPTFLRAAREVHMKPNIPIYSELRNIVSVWFVRSGLL